MIQAGNTLPDAQVFEFVDEAHQACTLGLNTLDVREQTAGERVVIFGLPGAFTPICLAKRVPGYLEQLGSSNRSARLASTRSGACPSTTHS